MLEYDDQSLRTLISLLRLVYINDPLKNDLCDSKKYQIFLNNLWLFLKEYALENEKYFFFYVEFLLSFLSECQISNSPQNLFKSKSEIISCHEVVDILNEILPKILQKNYNFYHIAKDLAISYVQKISIVFGKDTICSIKCTKILKEIISYIFIIKQMLLNDEVLNYIFENCFTLDTQEFFSVFLFLCYPKLQVISIDTTQFRNVFFGNLRKHFLSLNDKEEDSKIESEILNWKVKIICKLFQNLLLSTSTEHELSNNEFEFLDQKKEKMLYEFYNGFENFNYKKVKS